MDDRLLMRVLHSFTDLDEQFHPFSCRQFVLVAIGRDGQPGDILHHEIGAPVERRARVEHLGDVRVIHQRQRLALGLEPRHHFGAVRAGPCQFDGDPTPHRLLLLRQPNLAHSADADQFEQGVRPDDVGGGRPSRKARSARGLRSTPNVSRCFAVFEHSGPVRR